MSKGLVMAYKNGFFKTLGIVSVVLIMVILSPAVNASNLNWVTAYPAECEEQFLGDDEEGLLSCYSSVKEEEGIKWIEVKP